MLNQQQTRIIDPILTTVAQGYKHPQFVGGVLFPRVPVYASGGQILEFGKEGFMKYSLRRAPGTATKRITFGYLGKPYALVQDALEMTAPREHIRDAAAVAGVDIGTRSVNLGMQIIMRSLEAEQALLAITAGNYDAQHKVALAGADKWSAATGVPLANIETAKEAIRASTGLRPNKAVFSAVAWAAFRNNPQVKDQFKYTSAESVTTKMAAALLQLEQVEVGDAIEASDAGAFTDSWGNNVVLAYVPSVPTTMEEPSYGYTYTMEGHPLVEEAYFDKNVKSWIYPVTMERAPVLSGIASGYLIQTPN